MDTAVPTAAEAFAMKREGDQGAQGIFRELELVRKKQIELAREHIKLETMASDGLATGGDTEEDTTEAYRTNAERFAQKEADMLKLMEKLEELGGAMSRLHAVSTAKDRTAGETARTSPGAAAFSRPAPQPAKSGSAASLASSAIPMETTSRTSAGDLGVGSEASLASSVLQSTTMLSAASELNSSQRSLSSSVVESAAALSMQSSHTSGLPAAGRPEVFSIPRTQDSSFSQHSLMEVLGDRAAGTSLGAPAGSTGSVRPVRGMREMRPSSSSSLSLDASRDDDVQF